MGLFVIIAVFGVFGVWAATAPLSGAVIAQGQMAVTSNTKTIQHQEGGIVRAIHVDEGDRVEESDVLVELDRTQRLSELQSVRARLMTDLAASARLEAEADGAESLSFPQRLDGMATSGLDVDTIRTTQRILFQARRAALESELAQQSQRIEQLRTQISGIETVIASIEEQIASYSEEVQEWRELYEDEVADKQELREARRRELELEAELASQRAEVARLRAEVDSTETARTLTQREYDREVATQLGEIRQRILESRAQLPALQQRLERTTIRAPVSGQVIGLNVHTVGGVIGPGDSLMEIVPGVQDLIVRARVSPEDIDDVRTGQDVRLRFPGLNTAMIEEIMGEVESVSSDTLREEDDGTRYYLARVRILESGVEKLRQNEFTLDAGMPVTAMVQTGDRTLFSYMMKPISDMMARSLREP